MKYFIAIALFGFMLFYSPFTSPVRAVDAGIGLIISSPMGEMTEVAKTGMGLGAKFLHSFEAQPWFSLRGDLGYLSYDSRQSLINWGGYPVSQTIRQEGFQLALGPQIMTSYNTFRFYLSPMVGYNYFQTVISVPQLAYYGYYASDTRDSYSAFSWSVGGGFMWDIGLGPLIDIGVKYNYLIDGVRKKVDDGATIVSDGSDLTITLGVVFFSDTQ